MKAKVFFKKDSASIIFNETPSEIYFATFDYEFRLITAFKNPNLYRRGFNNQVLVGNVFSSKSFFLTKEDSKKVLESIYEDATELFRSGNYQLELKLQNNELVEIFVERAKETTFQSIILDGEKFDELYKPITIIPPDQYLALYIPITEGCSYNKCSFCNLYKDRKFRIKDEEEMNDFITKVINYFGSSLLTRNGIFLGEGNALVEKTDAIISSIKVIKDNLRSNRFIKFAIDNQFTGFMDTFHTKKDREELRELRKVGLSKVFIGLESGSEYILNELLMKPSNNNNLIQTAKNLKDVGINLGITVMIGIGGKEFSDIHVSETINVLSKLNLSENDIIYLSPIVEYPNLPYSQLIDKYNLSRLTHEEIKTQISIMKETLSKKFPKTKISIYRVDRFIY